MVVVNVSTGTLNSIQQKKKKKIKSLKSESEKISIWREVFATVHTTFAKQFIKTEINDKTKDNYLIILFSCTSITINYKFVYYYYYNYKVTYGKNISEKIIIQTSNPFLILHTLIGL